jgi:hypothetical protein
MRATVLWASDGASIVLTFHHAIADARSGIRIIDDLMRALAGEHLDALPPLPPVEQTIAGYSSSPVVTSERASNAGASKAWKCVAQTPATLTANILILEWDQKETARLVQCCKGNRTTVHGAICAAAGRHLPASDNNTIRILSPMDLSRIAGIEPGNCGVFIGVGVVEIHAARRKPLWLDARDILDGLQAARSTAAVARMLQWIAAEFPPNAGKDMAGDFFASQPQSSAVISNLGVLPLATDYGPLMLKAIWGPAMLPNLPADRQTIGISTFAGRLRMVHQSYQPIPRLLDAISGTLLASCVQSGVAALPANHRGTPRGRATAMDGAIVWVAVTVSLAHEPDGSPNYFIPVTEDISARKDAEDRSAAPAPARLRRCSPSASAS